MKIKLLCTALGFVVAVPLLAAPIVEGQPETGGYPLAQNNAAQSAAMMQVQTSNTDPSDLVNTVTQLQQQVRDLEGRLEVQAHQIDQLTQAQKNIYLQLGNRSAADTAIDAAAANLTTVTVNTAAPKPTKSEGVSVKPVASTAATTPVAATTASATNTNTAVVAATKSNNDDQQKALYDKAYQAITQQQYTDASVEMNSYLSQYPNGYYAANAHYWLGEIGLVGGDLGSAQTHFQAVVTQFPNTPKVSDAQLKLGYIYYQQGKWALARQTLQSLVQQYPNTSAATLATQRLEDMTKQGV